MGAKYSYGVWEYFADQASTILGKNSLILFPGVQTLAGQQASNPNKANGSEPTDVGNLRSFLTLHFIEQVDNH